MKARPLAALLAAGLVLAGCYGSTEPATDLRPNGATLNARGTADNGPAVGFFEYWPTADPSAPLESTRTVYPAGASGPISAAVRGLRYGTQYSFRACGEDVEDGGAEPVCAQTRTFTTPVGDSADGAFGELAFGGERPVGYRVDASSGPAGQFPKGEVTSFGIDRGFTGRVTCLAVQGTRAAVGAVGRFKSDPPDGNPERPGFVLITVDLPPGAPRTVNLVTSETTGTPNCATASFAGQQQVPIVAVTLQDAP